MNRIHYSHKTRSRPHWWPENEPWPPHIRSRRPRFFRRMGCLLIVFNLIGLTLFVGIITLIGRWAGLINLPFDPSKILLPVGIGVFLFVMLMVGMGGMGMRRLIIPLDDLLKAADQIGEGDYSVRVPESGPREIRSLSRAFNNMASRLHVTEEHRRELLADVTHELRNPLTVVQGNLEGMLDGVYPANETNLRSLLEETKTLTRLVEDLRTLALAESGALQLKKEPTDLSILIRDTLASFKGQLDNAKISSDVEAVDDLPWLEIDAMRIRQVLSNLVANALRYTPTGGKISVRYRQEDGQAMLSVHDTGPGIAAADLPHVFERFYKSTDSGGMGLGLAIARHLVEAHGGTITVESSPGQGTTMRVILPMGQ
jgi:two-component system sensor histidine kinase BaeS